MAKSSKRMFLVSVAGITGYFSTKTGGEVSADTTKVWDGGALQPDVIAGPGSAANLVLGRPYDVVRDNDLMIALRKVVGRWTGTVSVQPTNGNLTATGKATVYPAAVLVRLGEVDTDASSGDGAMFELEFAVGSYR